MSNSMSNSLCNTFGTSGKVLVVPVEGQAVHAQGRRVGNGRPKPGKFGVEPGREHDHCHPWKALEELQEDFLVQLPFRRQRARARQTVGEDVKSSWDVADMEGNAGRTAPLKELDDQLAQLSGAGPALMFT